MYSCRTPALASSGPTAPTGPVAALSRLPYPWRSTGAGRSICDGIRTPIGRFGGALASVRADELAAMTIRALMARHPQLPAGSIDEIVLGCANQAGEYNRNVARMAGLLAGLPVSVPGVTVNRLCASGLDAIGSASRAIR